MAITTGGIPTASVSNTTVAPIALVPPGPSTVILTNVSGVTVYIGAVPVGTAAPTATVVVATGFPIPSGAPPVVIPGSMGSAPTQLYLIAGASGATAGVGWLISTTR
jgi:hypothetical protein